MWRKTRQPNVGSSCIGTDANRNFNSNWMANEGGSQDPCTQTYAGPAPFSEPEVKALADYIAAIKQKVNMLLAFHSYGQQVLSPYGYTAAEQPSNYADMQQVAKAYADAVVELPYRTVYDYGGTAETLC